MLFNSLQFLVFFVIVTSSYFLLPHRHRWLLLLLVSCYFYMAFVPMYIVILGATIVVDYAAGIWIENSRKKHVDGVASGKFGEQISPKIWLVMSLIANIGVLAVFKYYNFFADNLNLLLPQSSYLPLLQILLPIGLSFHTFQAMSYTIEVYRGNQVAERHFGYYALYVMYYPQLVAGPIERPQNVLHQFHTPHTFDWERVKSGMMQMAFGFFKKVVIADRLAMLVDFAYGDIAHQSGAALAVAAVAYSFQIYCDFSGYSDIALGAARIMGVELMQNFNVPYISTSITEFWRRWHISLSTWFRDYLYIPLGGSRVSAFRRDLNVFIVFAVSGLWHGANWTFIVWGLLHGAMNTAESLWRRKVRGGSDSQPSPLPLRALQWLITFTLITLAWVFFRARTLTDAVAVITKIITWDTQFGTVFKLHTNEIIAAAIFCILLMWKEIRYAVVPTRNNGVFWVIFLLLSLCCYLFGVFNVQQFIYFQF